MEKQHDEARVNMITENKILNIFFFNFVSEFPILLM